MRAVITVVAIVSCAACSGATDEAADGAAPDAARIEDARGRSDPTTPPGDADVDARSDDGGAGSDASDDGAGWCANDPTARPNAGLVEEPGAGGCPAGMARVATARTFCVDRFEAAIVVVNGDGTTTSTSPYSPPPQGKTLRAVSLRGAVPQSNVSGATAKLACEGAGKRLCTNDEWLRACRGPDDRIYPYGNTRRPGVCNDARATHPAAACFHSTDAWIYSELDYPGINQQPNTVERTGARLECVTVEGLFDMMGNLHEWIFDPSPTNAIDFRGGFYADTRANGDGCLYRTTAHAFTYADYSTGFRCCAD